MQLYIKKSVNREPKYSSEIKIKVINMIFLHS